MAVASLRGAADEGGMTVDTTVAESLVRFLREQGVSHVFGVSGHSVFDVTDAIYQEPGIDFVPAQIEIGAGYMADGYARGTRGLGVCLVSAGAGVTNALSPLAQAYKESYPVLFISSDVSTRVAGKGRSSWHGIPQQETFAPMTRKSMTLRRPEDVFDVLRDAVQTVLTPPYGPVYLGIPRDLQTARVDQPDPGWAQVQRPEPRVADPRLIRQATDLLLQAAAPVILIGGGAHWARCEAEVLQLAELLGAPVGTSHSYKGFISEDHPLALGNVGGAGAPFANAICAESDVILGIGTSFSEDTTHGFGHRVIPAGARIVQIDVDPSEMGKTYPVEVGIVADAKHALNQILAALGAEAPSRASRTARLERLQQAKREWSGEQAGRGAVSDGPITRGQLFHTVRQAVKDDAVIVAEGLENVLAQRFMARSPVYSSGDFRAIGGGLGTALGLQCAFPDKQVVVVAGDGSFMMELQELATAVQAHLPVKVVVEHNGAYGNMRNDQIRSYGGRVIGTELHVPDLVALAAAFGVYGARVEKPADLAPALRAALAADGPALLDVLLPFEGRASDERPAAVAAVSP